MRKPMSDHQACNRVPDETVIFSDPRANFVSSLERGTEKSCVFSVVYRGQIDDSATGARTMKQQNLTRQSGGILLRGRTERITRSDS
jgi:hypothetical protein